MLAHDVATQLTAHDALGAHARDELGISNTHSARPIQAALASAATFALGAALALASALVAAWLMPSVSMIWVVAIGSLFFLAVLGVLAAKAGGASVRTSTLRVTLWGAFAMAVTAGVGALFGVVV